MDMIIRDFSKIRRYKMRKELEQAVEHANETNPGSRSGGKPSTSKKEKKKKTNKHN